MSINWEKINLEKELQKLKKIRIEERAEDIKYLVGYVKKKKGDRGLALVEKELEKIGFELPDLSKINDLDWVHISVINIFFLACIKVFKWREEDIMEMAKQSLSFKKMTRIYLRYFSSVQKSIGAATRTWKKHYTRSSLELVSCDEEKRKMVLRLKNFKAHPLTCGVYFAGLFLKIMEIQTRSKNIDIKETKCIHKGDPYHEYLIKW